MTTVFPSYTIFRLTRCFFRRGNHNIRGYSCRVHIYPCQRLTHGGGLVIYSLGLLFISIIVVWKRLNFKNCQKLIISSSPIENMRVHYWSQFKEYGIYTMLSKSFNSESFYFWYHLVVGGVKEGNEFTDPFDPYPISYAHPCIIPIRLGKGRKPNDVPYCYLQCSVLNALFSDVLCCFFFTHFKTVGAEFVSNDSKYFSAFERYISSEIMEWHYNVSR